MLSPTTTEEVAEIVRGANQIHLSGTETKRDFSVVSDRNGTRVSVEKLSGVVELMPADQVVVVKGGTSIQLVQQELSQYGQCLPLVEWYDGYAPTNIYEGTVGGDLSLNLPHYLEAECGNWCDWILGLTMVLADGTICKSGSHAVKNVAGYDIHKLMVGARGTLGVIAEVILRTYPVKSLPEPQVLANWLGKSCQPGTIWFQRVDSESYESAWENAKQFYSTGYPRTNTLWCLVPPDQDLPRFPGDWVIRSGCGEMNVQINDPAQIKLMKRAKQIFDPTNKLNPGEWGFM